MQGGQNCQGLKEAFQEVEKVQQIQGLGAKEERKNLICDNLTGSIGLHIGMPEVNSSRYPVSLNFNFYGVETGVNYRYVSKVDTVKVYAMDERVAQHVCDYRISYQINKYTLTANINNVFNYNYTQVERNMGPIRNFVLTLSTNF